MSARPRRRLAMLACLLVALVVHADDRSTTPVVHEDSSGSVVCHPTGVCRVEP